MTAISYVTEIKPYSPAELARIYGVTKKTINRWLKPHRSRIGEREGLFYTALQVRLIFERLGLPGRIEEN